MRIITSARGGVASLIGAVVGVAALGAVLAIDLANAQPAKVAGPASTVQSFPPLNRVGQAQGVAWYALVDATVHVSPTKTLKRATIVMRDGAITDVLSAEDGNAEPPKPPAGAQVRDAAGLHVYAGFIEPFLEVDAPRPEPELKGSHWSASVMPQRRAMDGRGADEGTAKQMRGLGFVAAVVSPRGGIFRGQSAAVSLAASDGDPTLPKTLIYSDTVYQTVAMETTGAGGAAGRWPSYPGSQMGAIAMIRQVLSEAAFVQSAEGSTAEPSALREFGRKRMDYFGGASGGMQAPAAAVGGQTPLLMIAEDELEITRVCKIANEFGVNAMVLGNGTEFRRLKAVRESMASLARNPQTRGEGGGGPAWHGSLLLPVNFPEKPRITSVGDAEEVALRDLQTWEQAPTNPRRVKAAGIPAMFTTARLKDRNRFLANVREAIRFGLKEEDALAMLTTDSASMLGLSSILGTIENGKRASMIVCDGPIFAKKTKIRDVWVDGQRHEISAAPIKAEGFFDIKLDPAPPTGGKRAMSIDKDNGITLRIWPEKGKEQKSKAKSASITEDRITFVFDHEPLGMAGMFTMSGIVERDATGKISGFSGTGQRTGGEMFRWSAARGEEPKQVKEEKAGLIGKWRVTNMGGVVMEAGEDQAIIEIKGETAATFTVKTQTIELKDVSAKGDEFSYTLAMSPPEAAAAAHEVKVKAKRDGDKLTGTVTMAGAKEQVIEAVRVTDPAKPESEKSDKKPDDKAAADKKDEPKAPDDGVSGTWACSVTGPMMPPGASSASMTLKLDGTNITGTATSPMGTAKVEGTIDAAKKVMNLTMTRDQTGQQGTIAVTLDGSTLSGKVTVAGMAMDITGKREGGKSDKPDEEKEEPADAPDELPGLPFGPFAMKSVPTAEHMIFTHATVWTSGKDGIITDGEVEFDAGKIVYVGKSRALPASGVPKGVRVFDCTGKHITPGLIDCHSHTGISKGVNEGGQAVTAEVRVQDVTNPDVINWYRQLAGGITMVNNLHGSANAIGGQNQVNKVRWGCVSADDMHMVQAMPGIKFALGENPKGGNGEGRAERYPQTRMGVETIIRDRFTAAKEYAGVMKDYNEQVKSIERLRIAPDEQRRRIAELKRPRLRDLELEALAEILAGERLVHCHSYRQDEILMLARVAKDFGFKIGTYQHILEGYKVADLIRESSLGASGFSDWWAYKVEVQDAIPQGFPIMFEQGVVVSFNSDSDEMARRMNVEASKGVKYARNPDGTTSVSPEEALKWVTINPAKQLRVDQWTGSLEVGKDADVVVWSGDPLSAFSKAEQTWVDGALRFSIELDKSMREINAKERARLIQKVLRDGPAKKKDDKPADPNAKPDETKPGDTPPAGRPGRRPRPTNQMFVGEMDEFSSDSTARTAHLGFGDLGAWSDAARSGSLSSGGRVPLIARMNQEAIAARRELYLDMLRRGINPEDARAGECGCGQ